MPSITEKARAEAERRAKIAHTPITTASGRVIEGDEQIAYRRGFHAGAEFGYAARAAEEPSDEQVERAARAIYALGLTFAGFSEEDQESIRRDRWNRLEGEPREACFNLARAALHAARGTGEQA